jgi:hypothetical protein
VPARPDSDQSEGQRLREEYEKANLRYEWGVDEMTRQSKTAHGEAFKLRSTGMTSFKSAAWTMAALVALWSPADALAQAVANATIHGVVADATGAVIPHAQIKARQTDIGQVRATASNSDGSYVLPNLPVGPYSIEVTAPSFSSYVQSGVVLQVGNNVQVNVTLQVGAVSQELRVAANAALVETQDTSISEVVDQRRIVDLPLNGRQATDLILLSGGANVPPNAASRVVTTHDYVSAVGSRFPAAGRATTTCSTAATTTTHSNVNLPFPPRCCRSSACRPAASRRATNHLRRRERGHNSAPPDPRPVEFVHGGAFNARNFFAPIRIRCAAIVRRHGGAPILGQAVPILRLSGARTAPRAISFVPTQAALSSDFSTLESAGCQSSRRTSCGSHHPANSPTTSSARPASAPRRRAGADSVAGHCGQITYAIPAQQ